LALLDVSDEGLRSLQGELAVLSSSTRVHAINCDVSDAGAVQAAMQRIDELTGGAPDVLISNAGVVNGADIEALSPEQLERCFKINTIAAFHLTRSALPHMKRQDAGTLVFVASVMGMIGSARLADYCASKWALLGFCESLRLELQRDGHRNIDIVVVLPYAASTGMFPGIFEDPRDRNWLRSLLFPLLTPEAVAACVADAVAAGGNVVVAIPRLMYWAAWGVHCLPLWLSDALTGYFGGWHGMSSFQRLRPPLESDPAPHVVAGGVAEPAPALTGGGPTAPGGRRRRASSTVRRHGERR
jgi:all-trans-retinol dehydrogenase (NAD+)